MRGLARRQREVLEAIIADIRATGYPPSQGRVAEITGLPSPWIVLDALAKKGYVRQPYPAGAWIPIRDLDGTPLRLELVRGEDLG